MTSYSKISDALAADDPAAAAASAPTLLTALAGVDMKLLTGDAHMVWMSMAAELTAAAEALGKTPTLEAQRVAMITLTNTTSHMVNAFGLPEAVPVWRMHCPMANDNDGADWLQLDAEKRNPYMGPAMLKCGVVEEIIGSDSEAKADENV